MARIRGANSRKYSIREETASAVHDDANDHEASELGALRQHETVPDDASEYEAEQTRKGEQVVESGIRTEMIISDDVGSTRKLKKSKVNSRRKLKKRKSRLMVNIYKQPDVRVGPTARLAIETRKDSDDATLRSSRKRKAAQRNSNKQQKGLKANEPRLNESSGSGLGVGRHVAAAGVLEGGTGPGMAEREVLGCTLNQNPADFLASFESGNFWRF